MTGQNKLIRRLFDTLLSSQESHAHHRRDRQTAHPQGNLQKTTRPPHTDQNPCNQRPEHQTRTGSPTFWPCSPPHPATQRTLRPTPPHTKIGVALPSQTAFMRPWTHAAVDATSGRPRARGDTTSGGATCEVLVPRGSTPQHSVLGPTTRNLLRRRLAGSLGGRARPGLQGDGAQRVPPAASSRLCPEGPCHCRSIACWKWPRTCSSESGRSGWRSGLTSKSTWTTLPVKRLFAG